MHRKILVDRLSLGNRLVGCSHGPPGALVASRRGRRHRVLLREGQPGELAPIMTGVKALQLAAEVGIPAPLVLAYDDGSAAQAPLILMERVPGSSLIPVEPEAARLAALAATGPASQRRVFVHGDLWSGNTLWAGGQLTALLDWDSAGAGDPGVDLGSLRLDAALCYGPELAVYVRAGREAEAGGRPATSPTGIWPRRWPRHPTWAGSRKRSASRAVRTSTRKPCSCAGICS
jgi:aminoglycoside phosphotransferase